MTHIQKIVKMQFFLSLKNSFVCVTKYKTNFFPESQKLAEKTSKLSYLYAVAYIRFSYGGEGVGD